MKKAIIELNTFFYRREFVKSGIGSAIVTSYRLDDAFIENNKNINYCYKVEYICIPNFKYKLHKMIWFKILNLKLWVGDIFLGKKKYNRDDKKH